MTKMLNIAVSLAAFILNICIGKKIDNLNMR